MTESLVPLSERELSALLVCVEAGSIMGIGHWKDICESLEARGFMRRADEFNFVATAAGKKAAVAGEDDNIRQFLTKAAPVIQRVSSDVPDLPVLSVGDGWGIQNIEFHDANTAVVHLRRVKSR